MKNCICIVCRGGLKNLTPRGNQPIGGTAFATTGHYGSTVFDPMDGTVIEVNVCDACLKVAAQDGVIMERRCIQSPKHVYRKWKA